MRINECRSILEAHHSSICSIVGTQVHPGDIKSNWRSNPSHMSKLTLMPHLTGRKWKESRLFYFIVGWGWGGNKSLMQEWLTAPSGICSSLLFLCVAVSKSASRPIVRARNRERHQPRKWTLPFLKKSQKQSQKVHIRNCVCMRMATCMCLHCCCLHETRSSPAHFEPSEGRQQIPEITGKPSNAGVAAWLTMLS